MPQLKTALAGLAGSFLSRALALLTPVCALLLLPGCDASGTQFLTNGIGTQLAANDIESASEQQNAYFDQLCHQAGLAPYGTPGNVTRCNPPLVDQKYWTLIVQQGMNDIDRRCDQYLAWLDQKKRSKSALIRQVDAVETATSGIISIANPPGGKAVAVVAQAFGLVANSIENYHSLLFEIESSTVNSVVLKGQHRFRNATQNFAYASRPAAEYALRSYLRTCLPFAIESQINDLSTLASKGIDPEPSTSIIQSPADVRVLGAHPVAADTGVDVGPGVRGPRESVWPDTISESRIDLQTAKAIQSALCFPANQTDGVYGEKTGIALKIYKAVLALAAKSPTADNLNWQNASVTLSGGDIRRLRNNQICPVGAKNYLENWLLTSGKIEDTAKTIAQKIRAKYGISDNRTNFPALREEISTWRSELKLDNGPGGMLNDQITPELLDIIVPARG